MNYFSDNTKNCKDYSVFGSILPGRSFNSNEYRFGFNGMEKDDEITGVTGSHYTTYFRGYDSRVARWWSIDPVFRSNISMYAGFSDNPIIFIDPRGDDEYFSSTGLYLGSDNRKTNEIRIVDDNTVGLIGARAFFTGLKAPNEQERIKLYQDNNTKLINFQFDNNNKNTLAIIVKHYNETELHGNSKIVTKVNAPFGSLTAGGIGTTWSYAGDDENFKGEIGILAGMTIDGYAKEQLHNKWDIVSTLVHENHHLKNDFVMDKTYPNFWWNPRMDKKSGDEGIMRHLNAYNAQLDDENWSKTTKGYKAAQYGYIKDFIEEISSPELKENTIKMYKDKYKVNIMDYKTPSSKDWNKLIITDD